MQHLCTDMTFVKSTQQRGEVSPVRCKRWSCPVCHELNRKRVIALARRAKPKALLTLTIAPAPGETPDAAAARLKDGLRLLRLRLKRHPRFTNFEFLAVFERHKSGFPHLHLLIRGKYLPWKWLRSTWKSITGAHQIDIRKIDTRDKAVFYVAKYIGKDLTAFEGCKRWWRSHSFSEEDTEEYEPDNEFARSGTWEVSPHALRYVLRASGYAITPLGKDRWRYSPDCDDPLPFDYAMQTAARLAGGSGKRPFRGHK